MSRRKMVNVSISPFSPKPHTPFQRDAMNSCEELLHKSQVIKFRLKEKKNVKVGYRDPSITWLETVMARGDRRIADVIYRAWQKGARFDGWNECFNLSRWREAAIDCNVDMDVFTKAFDENIVLPWSAISVGVGSAFLADERRRAGDAQVSRDCRDGSCTACGACEIVSRSLVSATPVVADTTSLAERYSPRNQVVSRETRQVWYRFMYEKGRDVRFLAHLDMVSVLQRALLAAGASVAYSEGYHPHPRVSFGPPLALGAMGEKELFDVVLKEPFTKAISVINSYLPDGLRLEALRQRPEKADALNALITVGRYVMVPIDSMERAEVRDAVERVLASKTLPFLPLREGKKVERDIRPLIRNIEYFTHEGAACIETHLSMLPAKTCRPAELLAVLFPGKRFCDFLVRRIECMREENGKMIAVE